MYHYGFSDAEVLNMPARRALMYNRRLPGVLQEVWGKPARTEDKRKPSPKRGQLGVANTLSLTHKLGTLKVVPKGTLAEMREARITARLKDGADTS